MVLFVCYWWESFSPVSVQKFWSNTNTYLLCSSCARKNQLPRLYGLSTLKFDLTGKIMILPASAWSAFSTLREIVPICLGLCLTMGVNAEEEMLTSRLVRIQMAQWYGIIWFKRVMRWAWRRRRIIRIDKGNRWDIGMLHLAKYTSLLPRWAAESNNGDHVSINCRALRAVSLEKFKALESAHVGYAWLQQLELQVWI